MSAALSLSREEPFHQHSAHDNAPGGGESSSHFLDFPPPTTLPTSTLSASVVMGHVHVHGLRPTKAYHYHGI